MVENNEFGGTSVKSEFLNTLEQRGFIHQATDLEGLDTYLAKTPEASAYIGFDCTAPTRSPHRRPVAVQNADPA